MSFQFFCPRWGAEKISWRNFTKRVKNAGYDGIEFSIATGTTINELESIWEMIDAQSLTVIPQHYDTNHKDFNQHYDEYAQWFQKLEKFDAVKINSQTGKDYFSFEENKALIDLAQNFSKKTGTLVCHETHRGKFSFAAHITYEYLQRLPYLQLTFDVSHWVNVAESYLEDQEAAIALAINRSSHIHARIGYPEGPQVTDPRSPEWKKASALHFDWWRKIASLNPCGLTITPEFGPHPYLIHHPFTGRPVACQWDMNIYMMEMIRNNIKTI